jgi:hypothetical protein
VSIHPISLGFNTDSLLDNEAIAKQREKLAKLERENAAMKIKLAKAARSNTNGKSSIIQVWICTTFF